MQKWLLAIWFSSKVEILDQLLRNHQDKYFKRMITIAHFFITASTNNINSTLLIYPVRGSIRPQYSIKSMAPLSYIQNVFKLN